MQQGKPFARTCYSARLKRRDRGGKQLDRVPRRRAEPAGDGDDAGGIEVVEIGPQRLDRVDRAFAEGLQAGRGGGGGIEQR